MPRNYTSMCFAVPAEAYDRFMGLYSVQLGPQLADLAGVTAGRRALDVGCGPGALTGELVARLGKDAVAAVDPSEPFVAAARERHPGVDVRQASAEQLPYADGDFDAALAQLVVHFLPDPVAGLREMARVTRPGGVVAACVWDYAGGQGPPSMLWRAALELDPDVEDESHLAGAREGHLAELFAAAGLREIDSVTLTARVDWTSFEDWWQPLELGVGAAGAYVASVDDERRAALRDRCRELLGPPPFAVVARALAARGVV
jgi:SAM-dependent methyltransferase